jgi:hypothetical protein
MKIVRRDYDQPPHLSRNDVGEADDGDDLQRSYPRESEYALNSHHSEGFRQEE